MYKKLKLFSVVGILALILTATLGVQAKPPVTLETQDFPQQISDDGLTVTIKSTENANYLMNYWTRARRLEAQPLPFPTEYDEEFEGVQEETVGEPGFAQGRVPNKKADKSAKSNYPDEWQALNYNEPLTDFESDGFFDDYGTAAVFTSYLTNYYSNMYLQFPYRAVGKVYISGGGYCSASVISPNVIVTAAHCVYDTSANRWYSGWTFVPADRNGAAPYGSFAWSSAKVLSGWINASGTVRRYDVALIKLRPNSAGRNVSYYTGYLGRSWNYGYTVNLHAMGYPSNLSSGRYTYTCTAETFSGGTDVLGMGCNMTYGSSGGPWIRAFAPNVTGYVDSVVSGGTPGTNTFYGPRFSSSNIVPLCGTSTCWP